MVEKESKIKHFKQIFRLRRMYTNEIITREGANIKSFDSFRPDASSLVLWRCARDSRKTLLFSECELKALLAASPQSSGKVVFLICAGIYTLTDLSCPASPAHPPSFALPLLLALWENQGRKASRPPSRHLLRRRCGGRQQIHLLRVFGRATVRD